MYGTKLIPLAASRCKHGAISVKCPKCHTVQLLCEDEESWFESIGKSGRIYPIFVCRGHDGMELCQHCGPAKLIKTHPKWME